MIFLEPVFFALFGLCGIIILLYLLKLKRREVIISSVVLWQPLMRELQANTLIQRLRISLLLILQLIALAFLVMALANPAVSFFGVVSKSYIIIVDNSASMSVVEPDKRTRLQMAREIATSIVSASKASKEKPQFMLIATSPLPSALIHFSTDADEVINKINSVQQSEQSFDPRHLKQLLLGSLKAKQDAEVIFITDSIIDSGEYPDLTPKIKYIRVGATSDNLGITSFNVFAPTPETIESLPQEVRISQGVPYQICAKIKNFSASVINTTISLYHNDRFISSAEISLESGQGQKIIFNENLLPGILRLQIDRKDAFEIDNTCYAIIPEIRPLRVLICGEDNPFIRRAFEVMPFCEVEFTKQEPVSVEGYDLLVINNIPSFRKYNCHVIRIGSACGQGSEVEFPAIIDYGSEHWVMSSVSIADVVIGKARVLKDMTGFSSLVTGEGGIPLIRIAEEKFIQVDIAFDLLESDLPLRPAFVIMMTNIIEGIRNRGKRYFEQVSLHFPKTGLVKDKDTTIAVNFLIEPESDISVKDLPSGGVVKGTRVEEAFPITKLLYWIFAGLALAILLFEWIAFHKRWGV